MKQIGAHLSIVDGLEKIEEKMENLTIEWCEIFLKNQKTYRFNKMTESLQQSFIENIKNSRQIIVNGSYLINLVKFRDENLMKMFYDDLDRCEKLDIKYYLLHPGINTIDNKNKAIENVANQINKALEKFKTVTICLENSQGNGRALGGTFEELKLIIDLIKEKDRVGVILDTCNLFINGYEIDERTFKAFDSVIGFKYLKAIHLVNSKEEFGSKKQ